MTESEQIQRLQALAEVQTADISSLLLLVERLGQIVRRDHPDTPEVSETFLKIRKHLLQQRLESLETQNPGMAARLQELIDKAATIFPYDYE